MNLYELFGVAPTASETEIKRAYRKAIKKVHPDVAGGAADEGRTAELNKAYAILSDAVRRAYYDATGDTDPEVNKTEEDIRVNFLNLIDVVLDSKVGNPIRSCFEQIETNIASAKAEMSKRKQEMRRLRKLRENIQSKETVNIFHSMIDAKCKDAEDFLVHAAHSLEVLEGVRKCVDSYTFTGANPGGERSEHLAALLSAALRGNR